MSFWQWFKGLAGQKDPSADESNPMSGVRWVPASENPLGVELLDCRSFAGAMISTVQDPKVATSYVTLRGSSGEEYRGRTPEKSATCKCDLQYPHQGATADGPLFKAQEMEDKWDIYLYDGHLYFARSWTGDLMYRAKIEFRTESAIVVAIDARRELVADDPSYPIAAVDYLIRSHLYSMLTPHPLPSHLGRDLAALALFSFSQYGRRGLFGTFADTTRLNLSASSTSGA